jgi:hypothetical protein
VTTLMTTITRAGVVGSLALVGVLAAAGTAGAASEEAEFSCEFQVGGTAGEGTSTVSFDSGITDGLVTEVRRRVSLEPFTGTVTLPPEFVAALKDLGLTTIGGGGGVSAYFDAAEDSVEVSFPVGPVALPPDDTLTIAVDGDVETGVFRPQDPGVYTLFVEAFGLGVDTGEEDGPGAFISCVPSGDEDLVVDALEATDRPTPTTTVTATATATATPVRPVVVQTDAVEEEGLATAPLLAAGTLAALVAGGLALPRRASRASRRH